MKPASEFSLLDADQGGWWRVLEIRIQGAGNVRKEAAELGKTARMYLQYLLHFIAIHIIYKKNNY